VASSWSKTESRRKLPDRILVGLVLRPHGVRGAVMVEVQSDTPGRLEAGSELELVGADGRPRPVRVEESAPAPGRGRRLRLAGIESREQAEALRGARLEVPRERVPEPPAGALYQFELIGCRCFDRVAGELGEVTEVLADGGGWLLVVARPGGGRLPLPFVERFVTGIDREAGRIDWDLPEGLIEACASRS
jgi:16S rRNA processing protein RimM